MGRTLLCMLAGASTACFVAFKGLAAYDANELLFAQMYFSISAFAALMSLACTVAFGYMIAQADKE